MRDVNIGKLRADAIQIFAMVGRHVTFDQMQLYFDWERYRFAYGLSVLSPQSLGEYVIRIILVQEMVFLFDQIFEHEFVKCVVRVIG